MEKEYFCSYTEYVSGNLSRVGCCTIHINDDIADKMAFTKQEVAKEIDSNPEDIVLVAFNVI